MLLILISNFVLQAKMKFVVLIFALVLMTCEVARCAPFGASQLASDPQLDLGPQLSDGDFVRVARQMQPRNSPLAQLLQDALNVSPSSFYRARLVKRTD